MVMKEKACVLCFDEMKIKTCLEYSKKLDFIEGFEDLGSLKRHNKLGEHAMVFMARGLYSSWKIPLSYFICHGNLKQRELKELIVETVSKIIEAGFLPKAIICDQGTNNTAVVRNLEVTTEKPYFFIKRNKIYSIFDVPHLFKSLRNNFLKHDFIYKDKLVCFNDLIKTYEIDKLSSTARALTKITDQHMAPNAFEKMTCKYALQVFSHTFGKAMITSVNTKQLKSDTALDTAIFLTDMNNLFDCLNSKTLFAKNPNRCGLSEKTTVKKTLESARKALQSMKKCVKGDINSVVKNPPCFAGLIATITAILNLYEDERKADANNYFLATSRLNQDIIENLFSIIRQRGGYNRNPTTRTFRSTFKMNCVYNLMKPPKSANCEEDEDELLSTIQEEDPCQLDITSDSAHLENDNSDIDNQSETSSSTSTQSTFNANNESAVGLEECATVYFAGYLVKKCLDKFNCSNCENYLSKNNNNLVEENELLILNRNYDVTYVNI